MQIPSLRLRIHRLLDGQLQRGRFKRTDCRIQPRHHLLEYHNVSFGAFVSDTWYKREFHSLVHYICMSPAFGQQLLFDSGRWGGHVGVDACSRTVHAGGFSDVLDHVLGLRASMKSQNCDCQNWKGVMESSLCLQSKWFYSLDPCFLVSQYLFKAKSCHLKGTKNHII